MNRRDLLKTSLLGAAAAPALAAACRHSSALGCDDCVVEHLALPMPAAARLKVTGVKTFGVTSDVLPSDRPHVFVEIETDAGVGGWGEATLEGKAAAAMQAVHDLSYAIMGQDPMRVEHPGSRCTSTPSIARGRCWPRRSPASTRPCGTFAERCSSALPSSGMTRFEVALSRQSVKLIEVLLR